MNNDDFRRLIEHGDLDALSRTLKSNPSLANRTIHWFLNRPNESDPLHYVSDCIARGTLTHGAGGEIAERLLGAGAAINGTAGRESPLIAAVSAGAEEVAQVLIKAGAQLELTSLFGARALHWAAWMGLPSTVNLLVDRGASLEARCAKFDSTPLFWAVQGYGPNGPKEKRGQVAAARRLLEAGAEVDTTNKSGISALDQSQQCERGDMYKLLSEYHAKSK